MNPIRRWRNCWQYCDPILNIIRGIFIWWIIICGICIWIHQIYCCHSIDWYTINYLLTNITVIVFFRILCLHNQPPVSLLLSSYAAFPIIPSLFFHCCPDSLSNIYCSCLNLTDSTLSCMLLYLSTAPHVFHDFYFHTYLPTYMLTPSSTTISIIHNMLLHHLCCNTSLPHLSYQFIHCLASWYINMFNTTDGTAFLTL